MENLRWIILAVGLGVVLVIYWVGSRKEKTLRNDLPEPANADDIPAFNATETITDNAAKADGIDLDDVPFVATEINSFDLNQELVEKVSASVDEVLPDVMTTGSVLKTQPKPSVEILLTDADIIDADSADEAEPQLTEYNDDLIIIHVRAKSAYFNGENLLKVINHQQLKFGDMNIYHAYDETGSIIFSMSNMVEPGHFEPDHIADMRTPGVILFMQLSLVKDTMSAYERMLHTAETLARELDGKLMTTNQRVLSDQSIEDQRVKANYFNQSSEV